MKKLSLRCLVCGKTFSEKDLKKRGFIKARSEAAGGPYFLYKCVQCKEEMKCLKAREGWQVRAGFEEWGLFEFFRRILEGTMPLLGVENRKSGVQTPIAGRGMRGEQKKKKAEAKDKESARSRQERTTLERTEKVQERWKAFYRILGVPASAGREDVVKAFRRLSKRVHPDRFASCDRAFQLTAHRKFIELKMAYDTLLEERFSDKHP